MNNLWYRISKKKEETKKESGMDWVLNNIAGPDTDFLSDREYIDDSAVLKNNLPVAEYSNKKALFAVASAALTIGVCSFLFFFLFSGDAADVATACNATASNAIEEEYVPLFRTFQNVTADEFESGVLNVTGRVGIFNVVNQGMDFLAIHKRLCAFAQDYADLDYSILSIKTDDVITLFNVHTIHTYGPTTLARHVNDKGHTVYTVYNENIEIHHSRGVYKTVNVLLGLCMDKYFAGVKKLQ